MTAKDILHSGRPDNQTRISPTLQAPDSYNLQSTAPYTDLVSTSIASGVFLDLSLSGGEQRGTFPEHLATFGSERLQLAQRL